MIRLKEDHLKELLFRTIQNEDIQTVFQPIISLKDGELLGYEALSRGPSNTPLQNPEKLFYYAMEHDLLWDLEYLCRTKALESAYTLQSEGKLFLNVNPNIMNDPKFKHGFTKEYLSRYKFESDKIVFEITEKEAISKLSHFKKTVDHYKEQLYQIAIDDVGSGYSGLNIVTDIHPHFMKLDMKLIRDIDSDATKQSLVKSLNEFAAQSQISIIAEGIETKEELCKLIDLGVRYGQGYFIQKPKSNLLPIADHIIDIIVNENERKRKNSLSRKMDTIIGDISTPLPTIDVATLIGEVKSMMDQDNSIPGRCIVEQNRLVGVITRNQLHFKISGPYGYSLYSKRKIQEIMDTNFLQVDVDTPIHVVAKLAMMRDSNRLYDFITITKDRQYYGIVTVKELLEKSMEIEINVAKHMNPLTELPGNVLIEQQLQHCIDSTDSYGILYLDLDNFKPYNDVYGFEKGDQVLMHLAHILKEVVSPNDFIGHIGGDDFIVVAPSALSVAYSEQIIEQFDATITQFYTEEDVKAGWIASKNRHGKDELFPLLTISIAIIANHPFQSTYELAKEGSEVKKQCKQLPGSNYILSTR
ncbi:EAL domain-containing protein [Sporosarcina sp. ACRSL]|uniref:EAL domain-containing protein n=1 Tax=Sporosarcina sp. ACRSL TaxID=2918215 RepID=UPI001EF57663|nr:EAL domain-containing protein [Sporosarcina sp. ACRSL]MCG7345696.1 EAL domain-containing protein [Sporosarcina sp. ACRSL]